MHLDGHVRQHEDVAVHVPVGHDETVAARRTSTCTPLSRSRRASSSEIMSLIILVRGRPPLFTGPRLRGASRSAGRSVARHRLTVCQARPCSTRRRASRPVPRTSTRRTRPLAARMRPRSLDEVIGQRHLLGAGSPLRRLVEGDSPMSLILFGPPGSGKTTLALIVSSATNRRFVQMSALNSGVKRRARGHRAGAG